MRLKGIKRNPFVLTGLVLILLMIGFYFVNSTAILQNLRINKQELLPETTPEKQSGPANLTCNTDEDCGVDLCDCVAMNKEYIKPEAGICQGDCEGTPKCIKNMCKLKKEEIDNCYYSRITCVKDPCNPKRVCNSKNHNLIMSVVKDLSKRLQVDKNTIIVNKVIEMTWRSGSLGCPEPGKMYTQAIVPGYKISLTQNNNTYFYHTNSQDYFILCDKPQEPVKTLPK